jgi:hypothetical protein
LWSRGREGTFYLPEGTGTFLKSALQGGIGNFTNCGDGRTWLLDGKMGFAALPGTERWSDATAFGATYSGGQYLFCDREGGLWAALLAWDQFRLFRIPDEVSYVKNNYQLTPDELRTAKRIQSEPVSRVLSMLEDREGNIWVATYDGLERYRSNKVHSATQIVPLSDPVAAVTAQGDIWLASAEILLRFAPRQNVPVVTTHFICGLPFFVSMCPELLSPVPALFVCTVKQLLHLIRNWNSANFGRMLYYVNN